MKAGHVVRKVAMFKAVESNSKTYIKVYLQSKNKIIYLNKPEPKPHIENISCYWVMLKIIFRCLELERTEMVFSLNSFST